MAEGVLKRGFTAITSNLNLVLPKGTLVQFKFGETPIDKMIVFPQYPGVKLRKIDGQWFLIAWERLLGPVSYDRNQPPYPICYYEKKVK
jgi:hypothetical protein